jgi:hypothetical protein
LTAQCASVQIEEVWRYVRVFGGIDKWLPFVGTTDIKSELLVSPVSCHCTHRTSSYSEHGGEIWRYMGQHTVRDVRCGCTRNNFKGRARSAFLDIMRCIKFTYVPDTHMLVPKHIYFDAWGVAAIYGREGYASQSDPISVWTA